jgi:hypothetical protein
MTRNRLYGKSAGPSEADAQLGLTGGTGAFRMLRNHSGSLAEGSERMRPTIITVVAAVIVATALGARSLKTGLLTGF